MTVDSSAQVQIVRRSTSCIEQMEADVRAYFQNARFEPLPEERRARQRTHLAVLMGDIRIDRFESAGGELSGVGGNYFQVGFIMDGSVLVKRPRRELVDEPGGVGTVGAPQTPFSFRTVPGTTACILALTPASIEGAGRAILGDAFKLTEDAAIDMRNAAGRALVRNTSGVLQEIGDLHHAGLGRLAAKSYAEFLSTLSIAALFPELLLEEEPSRAAPARLVARAEEIIRARAHEPLTIREIAAEIGVTVRSLQAGFRRHLGCTPLGLLLKRRLLLARERLLDPAYRGDVRYAAMSCGFLNMHKFSRRYCAAFGEWPSQTADSVHRA